MIAVVAARWQALDRRVRGLGVAIVVGALAIAIGVGATRERRVPLFATPLRSEQLAEVDAALTAWNVAFTTTTDNVVVDTRARRDIAARLALASVPHAHVAGTAEALAPLGSLTPQSIVDAQTRAGLEGDLARNLRGIGGIVDARVIVAPAKAGTFADETSTEATASVRLIFAAGNSPSESTYASVRAFVAAAIPGLRAERVAIVDDRGIAENRNDDDRARRDDLQSALDLAFGGGTTIVRLRSERDERERVARDVRKSPRGIAIARITTDERFSSDKKRYSKTNESEERGAELHEERSHTAAGRLTRLSIAVFVDAHRALDVRKIRALCAATAGINPHRGDTLDVELVSFDHSRVAATQPWSSFATLALDLVPALALAAVLVAAIRVGAAPLRTVAQAFAAQVRSRSPRPARGPSAEAVFAALEGEPAYASAAILASLPQPLAGAVLEKYSEPQRRAIIARMARRPSPLLPTVESLFADGSIS